MAGGILQLVTYGVEDLYIIGEPQVTYFKTIYRRHTNFSRGEFDLEFGTRLDFGRKARCVIKRYGDLLHRLYLLVDLPDINLNFRSLSVGEVQDLLLTYDITWDTDRPRDQTFGEEAFAEVEQLVEDKLDEIDEELELINQILPIVQTELTPAIFFETFPNETEGSVQEYFDWVILRLIEFDQFDIQYKFIDAHDQDQSPYLPLSNANLIQQELFERFVEFATGVTTFDPASFNDENLLFLFNTDTANYSLGGSTDQLSSDTVFRAGISNIYGNTPFTNLDAYKIFDQSLLRDSETINSNFDVQAVKAKLLNNERFSLSKNPKQLFTVYNSLENDFKFIFYKKLTRRGPGVFDSGDDFVNLSLVQNQEEQFQDKFTSDFTLLDEPGEPSDLFFPYGDFVDTSVNNFHNGNKDVFRTIKFIDYFNNFNLWSRTDVGNPGDPAIDNFATLCQAEINALFGTVPSSLIRMYFLNYIPLLMANDIPIAIDRVLQNKIDIGSPNSANIIAFRAALLADLNTAKATLIANIQAGICIENDFETIDKLSGFRDRDGAEGDIILHAIVRQISFVTESGEKVLYPVYVDRVYTDILNNFNATGYNLELEDMLTTLNLFSNSPEAMPSYVTYSNLENNQITNPVFRINNVDLPLLSDAPSSIWYNILTTVKENYNDLYDGNILGRTQFNNSVGDEMESYLNFISETYFNSPTASPTPIDYWFNTTQSDLPVNDGQIGVFLLNKIAVFETQLQKFDENRKLLNMRSLVIPKTVFFFEVFNEVVNEIVDENIEVAREVVNGVLELIYNHEQHATAFDPVLDIKSQVVDPNDPDYNPNDPHENAMDIFNRTRDIYNDFILEPINPFSPTTDPNKNTYWDEISLPVKQFDPTDELNKYNTLFGSISPQTLFNQFTLLQNQYNTLLNEVNVYRFMKDLIVQASIFAPLFPLKDDTVTDTWGNIQNYYIGRRRDLSNLRTRITGTTETPGLLEILENSLSGGDPANFAWIQKLGFYMIECISVTINDQLIDKHTGEWMYIWYELIKKESKCRGHQRMIGDFPELYTFNNNGKPQTRMYIPIYFWFCRYLGAALPLISLQHSSVCIDVKLRPFEECAYFDDFTKFAKRPILNCKLLAEYVYIDTEERTRFYNNQLEYLIDTVQYSNDQNINKSNIVLDELTGTYFYEQRIFFENPCKELYWFLQNKAFIDGTQIGGEIQWHNYSFSFDKNKGFNITHSELDFSSRQRERIKPSIYWDNVQSYERHHSDLPDGVSTCSFALKPELFQPSGSANLSRLDDIVVRIRIRPEIVEEMQNFNAEYRFGVYCLAHNVLRIMSGLSGLAFFK